VSEREASLTLEVRGLVAGYGDLEILHGVDLTVGDGEWVALLGVAGAGKSTFMKALSGLIETRAGSIRFAGTEIAGIEAHRRVARGVALVPEGRRLFAGMTVAENLLAGAHTLEASKIAMQRERILSVFPALRERLGQVVGTLSGGEQQMCAIGRSLMSSPRLLLIDELSLGLAPFLVDELLDALERIRCDGTALLVVEQDVDAALRYANRAYVMQLGRIVLTGSAAEVRADASFAISYMGLSPT